MTPPEGFTPDKIALDLAGAAYRPEDQGLMAVSDGQIELPVATFLRAITPDLQAALRELQAIVGPEESVTVQRHEALHSHRGLEAPEWSARIGSANFSQRGWGSLLADVTNWWERDGKNRHHARRLVGVLRECAPGEVERVYNLAVALMREEEDR